jgi:TolA-binding protein
MSQSSVSRKKLLQEPDEFLSLSQRVWLWVHDHRDKTLLVGGGILAAVLLAVSIKAYVERSHEKRAAALAAAVARLTQSADGTVPADVRNELAGLAERYAGAPEGEVARYFQAGALAGSGETEQARQIYTTLASAATKSPEIATLSRIALAYLDLARGADEPAKAAFEALLKTEGAALPRAQIMMEIAGIHEKQGRAAEARKIYQDLIADHPDGSWAATAKERLRALAGRGPAAA